MGLVGGEGREDCWGIGGRVRVGSEEREGGKANGKLREEKAC